MEEWMTDGFDPVSESIVGTRDSIRAGDVTASDLVRRFLARIDAYDDDLTAFVRTNPAALDRAAALDESLAADGETLAVDGTVGPLHGVPVAVKDNFDTADLPTTAGSRALDGSPPGADATAVRRLRAAGAVVVGKANMHEFAMGAGGPSAVGGVTRNPYDRERTPGGSSTGVAAAVAAGLAPGGVGSDTGGSVRIPAAWSNLVGVRPTLGIVSRTGIVPLALSQDTAGPIARCVADAALLLDVLSGFDPADPVTARAVDRTPADSGGSYLDHARNGSLDGARIGVLGAALESTDAPTADLVEAAMADLAAAGATVVEAVSIPDSDPVDLAESLSLVDFEFRRDFDAYLAGRADPALPGSLAALVDSGRYGDGLADDLARAMAHDPAGLDEDPAYLGRLREQAALRDRVLAVVATHDLDAVAYPTVATPAVALGEQVPRERLWTYLAACADCPAITVQAGFADGLPIGLEFLGRPFAEPRLLELAAGYEAATDHRRPPTGFDGD